MDLHATTGNAITDGYTIVIGHGATQLINAATYAVSQVLGKQISVFAQTPYFAQYRQFAEFNPAISVWNASYEMSDQSSILEFVTNPNNPDGTDRQPWYKEAHHVWDMVYHWPSMVNYSEPASHDIMLFSMSKLSGHAGTRFGWALVKDPQIASQMASFIGMMNVHPSIDAEHRALRTLQAIQEHSHSFFDDIRDMFQHRWNTIESIFAGQSRFKQISKPGGFYVWIQCLQDTDCYQVFKDAHINGESGVGFGASPDFARVEIAMRTSTFNLLVERLRALMAES